MGNRRWVGRSALLWLMGCALALTLWFPQTARAQIWVVRQPDGSQRFTTQPQPGAELFLSTRFTRQPGSGSSTTPFAAEIAAAAAAERVDPLLVRAVIATESNFDPRAVSSRGAQGLMQLMPETAARLGVEDVWDPHANIRGGTAHLAQLLSKYRDVRVALAAYNAGEGAVQRYGGVPPFEETRAYVGRVLEYYRRYRGAN